jgi:SAM-dependent methyltransferase
MSAKTSKSPARRTSNPDAPATEASPPDAAEPTAEAPSEGGAAREPCNICLGVTFKPGPNQRMVDGRIAPLCTGCGSFERHRIVRQIFDKLRPYRLASLNALQFGRDRGVAGGWFRSFRRADEDGHASTIAPLSITQIDIADAGMDVVVANYVLETLPDHRPAIREIGRVISDTGFAFIAVQSPHIRSTTQELARPTGDRHRTFGRDFETELATLLPDLHVIRTVGVDPVTMVEGWGYFITMDDDFAAYIFERGLRAKFVNIRKIIA